MAKLETVAVRPDRVLVKTFRPVALPSFKISQSKYISDQGKLYCILGQKTFHSPLYTHFIVIDSYGDLVEDQTGLKIYERISRLNIVQYIQKKEISFAKLIDPSELNRISTLNIPPEKSQLITALLEEGEQVTERFHALEREATKLFRKEDWKLADFEKFDQRWRSFWSLYERRLENLFAFREFLLQGQAKSGLHYPSIQTLFEEANEMHQLFVDMVPLEGPLITKINDYIQLQFELGKTRSSRTRSYAAPKGDVNIYHFVKFGLLISVVLSIFTLLRFMTGRGGLFIFVLMAIITVFFLSVRLGNEVGMLRLVEKRLKDLRAKQLSSISLIERQYKKAFAQLKKLSPATMEAYEFIGSLVKVARWILFIGIALVLVGLFYVKQHPDEVGLIIGHLLSGGLLLGLGLLLPRTKLARRQFVLRDNELQIGKKTYTREDVIHVRMYPKAHQIKLKLRTHPDPITYKIDQSEGKTINSKLQLWCDVHFVNYKI